MLKRIIEEPGMLMAIGGIVLSIGIWLNFMMGNF